MTHYAGLEIRILKQETAGYPVEITLNHDLHYERGYLDPELPTGDGVHLFAWLFADPTLREAWENARGQHPRRRVRLRLDAQAPELHALPWEALRDPKNDLDLAAADATPFSRYLAGTWSPGSPIPTRPIQVLVAIADPSDLGDYDLAPIDADAEWAALQAATSDMEDIALTRLPQPCTLRALAEALRPRGNTRYHALHVIAHGTYSARRQQAALYLADEANNVAVVTDADFAALLKRQLADDDDPDRLRLIFLASCESATRSTAHAFRGLAPALVNAGVPAIVAMQDTVSITAARAFSSTFYARLLQHGLVDLAGNQARAALLDAKSGDAATPVVFSRLRSGKLFEKPGKIGDEYASSFWKTLLENIADGLCTPFLGTGVTVGVLPTTRELAQALARQYHYPFADCETLPRVAQFVGTMDNRRLRRDVLRLLTNGFRARMGVPSAAHPPTTPESWISRADGSAPRLPRLPPAEPDRCDHTGGMA